MQYKNELCLSSTCPKEFHWNPNELSQAGAFLSGRENLKGTFFVFLFPTDAITDNWSALCYFSLTLFASSPQGKLFLKKVQ